jgi:hypothetical protein
VAEDQVYTEAEMGGKKKKLGTQACIPSYSGGRDQGDHSLRPAQQIVLETLPRKGWWNGVQTPVQKKKLKDITKGN